MVRHNVYGGVSAFPPTLELSKHTYIHPHTKYVRTYTLQERASSPPWSHIGSFLRTTSRSFSHHWLHTGTIDPVWRWATGHPKALTRLKGAFPIRRGTEADAPRTYYVRIRLGDRSRILELTWKSAAGHANTYVTKTTEADTNTECHCDRSRGTALSCHCDRSWGAALSQRCADFAHGPCPCPCPCPSPCPCPCPCPCPAPCPCPCPCPCP